MGSWTADLSTLLALLVLLAADQSPAAWTSLLGSSQHATGFPQREQKCVSDERCDPFVTSYQKWHSITLLSLVYQKPSLWLAHMEGEGIIHGH